MDKKYECPECRDTGFIFYEDDNGYSYAKPCKCRAVKEAKDRLERSGLAKEFMTKSFDNYRTCDTPQLVDAKNTVMQYTRDFERRRNMEANSLMLCGQVGAGKCTAEVPRQRTSLE